MAAMQMYKVTNKMQRKIMTHNI